MKAMVYTQFGPPDVLQLKEVEKPAPKEKKMTTPKESPHGTNRKTAAVVGVLFIIGTGAGILSGVFTGSILTGPDYLIKVSANENQIIIGALLVLIMGLALAMVPVMLFPLFKKYNETLALGYVVFRGALETIASLACAMSWLLLVTLSRAYVTAGAPGAPHFQTLGTLILEAGKWNGHVSSIFLDLRESHAYRW